MSKAGKLLKRFLSKPTDFTWDEFRRLMRGFGYVEVNKGKTSGSRVSFVEPETKHIISLHKPHPHPTLKQYQLKQVEEALIEKGVI
ncbi:MAG: type II toxin-antitoxin system HicA family toxin [Thermodesulfobacteriota bacterium]